MDRITELYGINALIRQINSIFANKEPWQIVSVTASTVFTSVWLWQLLNQDESIVARTKKSIFKNVRRIPWIKRQIDAELAKVEGQFMDDIQKGAQGLEWYTELPLAALSQPEILSKVDEYLTLGNYKWREGKVSGAVYNYDEDLIQLITKVYGKTSYTNPLHADMFPGICKMESEVVRMTADMFHGGPNSCGTMTTGGTESILMACKAYRDYARHVHGITKPNMVIPKTAHSAFDKAAQYLGIYVKAVPVDSDTTTVNLKKMRRAINRNTIMLVGSAPNFPYGTIDNIEAIAALGKRYKIPVHVDACLGAFLIAFMEQAGFKVAPFDFRLDGVTSISADTHKYGFAPKGTSVILYSHEMYRYHQFTVTTDWPGGVYGSPTVNGSRAGGTIAATWATLLNHGFDGYVKSTKNIIDTTRYIESELRKFSDIYIFGSPMLSVIAIGSKVFEIYRLSEMMRTKGWNLNTLQFPSGVHICVTNLHTQDGVADQFINDIRSVITQIMINPEKPVEGKMAVYGVAQTIPDRALVGDFTRCFLNAMYYTPPRTRNTEIILK